MKILGTIAYFIIITIATYLWVDSGNNFYILGAVLLGGYMAVNIGANDVANSVGPAVGSGVLKLKWAIFIAAVGNIAGAVIAGGDVVKTVKNGIIDITALSDPTMFILIMLSALLAAALWLNVATYLHAPVSTTHSIVGGVMGGGIAAMGFGVVSWSTMGKIAASWVISPILGGIIAVIFLYSIKKLIIKKNDKVKYSKKWVPVFVAIMSWAFVTYLIIKGLKHIVKLDFIDASHFGLITAIIVYACVKLYLSKFAKKIENSRASIAKLFTIPLIFAVALLTFAHGANDVANTIGPLAAIYDAVINSTVSGKVAIPLWILFLGGTGIAVGLAIYGPRIIQTVGGEITEIDPIRAFCIALSAAITVIFASQLGLPVSSTHIALGAIFGVGFLREWLHKKEHGQKEKFVKRNLLNKIIAAWIITVPSVALLSGALFYILQLTIT